MSQNTKHNNYQGSNFSHTATTTANQAADKARDAAEQVRDKAQNAAEQVRDKAQQATEQVRTQVQNATEQVHNQAQDLTEKAQDFAAQAKDKAQDAVEAAKDKAQEVGTQVNSTVESAMTTTGDRMTDVAHKLRESAPESARPIAEKTADALERGGSYLREASPSDVRSDLESIIRKRPLETVLVGLAAGFLLARMTRR